jgi:hypothetical protein
MDRIKEHLMENIIFIINNSTSYLRGLNMER